MFKTELNVFDCQVRKVVSCLSTCIFPDDATYPIDEHQLHNGPPHHTNYGYAYAKRMLEITSRAYRQQHGCNFTCVIPTNIYGPNDNFYEGCHFIPSIIQRTCRAMQDGCDTMVVPGTGKALRQFIYSRDLAQILIWTLRNYHEAEPLLLSVDPEDEVSVKDVVSMVCSISNFKGNIHWDTSKTDGQLRKTADNTKMRGLVKDFKFTSLSQGTYSCFSVAPLGAGVLIIVKGLATTVEWYGTASGTVRGLNSHQKPRGSIIDPQNAAPSANLGNARDYSPSRLSI